VKHGLDVVVHEIGHYKQVDDLRKHEPVANILGQQTHGSISVELGVGEYPKDDE